VDLLAERYQQLPADAKRRVLVHLCRGALAVWEAHVRQAPELSWVERVAGTRQKVDVDLPRQAIDAVASGQAGPELQRRYQEPIAALQELDLLLPDPVEAAYYAIYNLARKFGPDAAVVDDWLIVNQAISAYPQERWRELVSAGLEAAG
jgi:hypothetical protein